MAARAILVVLVVRDVGLRTALAAHLSLDGLELLSAGTIRNGLLASPMIREPSILVIDQAVIPGDVDRWVEKQRKLARWSHLVILTGAAPAPVNGADWRVHVSARNARKLLSELLFGWSREMVDDR